MQSSSILECAFGRSHRIYPKARLSISDPLYPCRSTDTLLSTKIYRHAPTNSDLSEPSYIDALLLMATYLLPTMIYQCLPIMIYRSRSSDTLLPMVIYRHPSNNGIHWCPPTDDNQPTTSYQWWFIENLSNLISLFYNSRPVDLNWKYLLSSRSLLLSPGYLHTWSWTSPGFSQPYLSPLYNNCFSLYGLCS